MSIELRNVTKRVRMGAVKVTYENLNIRVEQDSRVAFLGHKEAGLEAIVKLICAADAPDRGTVTRTHSISWPIPSSVFLSKHLPLCANARFIARLYEADEPSYLARLAELGDLGKFMNQRADDCPNEIRSLFCFAAGVLLPFDHYILTNLNVGKKAERERVGEIVDDLRQRAGLLLVTHDVKPAQQFCDQAYVFDEGRATFYDDVDAAVEHFGTIAAKDEADEDSMDFEPELESLVNEDF